MIEHWPSGGRDTTEFPDVDISVEPNFRKHLEAFCKLEGIGWNDYTRQEQAAGLGVQPQRYRSYRKMYQNLGFIYPEDTKIKLSLVGKKLCQLPAELKDRLNTSLLEVRSMAVNILSKYQLLNPTEEQKDELPQDCDVLPCICIWKAMLALDNKLHYEEMNRVLLRVMRMADIDPAIRKIETARRTYNPYTEQSEATLTSILGEPVHTNQPTARIAYWYSFAGWGGLLIDQNQDQEGFRHLNESMINTIRSAVQNPPLYYRAVDEADWESYYIGDLLTPKSQAQQMLPVSADFTYLLPDLTSDLKPARLRFTNNILTRLLASCLTKKFVLITGLSGSGKTKLAHALAAWLTPPAEHYSDPFKPAAEIKSARISYFVQAADRLSVIFLNNSEAEAATKVALPRELIAEWVAAIDKNNFSRETPAQTIRATVSDTTKYSTQLNSFDTYLKAAAFAVIDSRQLSERIGNAYQVIPVGADWTNREPLFGYPDALAPGEYRLPASGALQLILQAANDPSHPYFLILDEMNLSHVERYFADVLSAMESGQPIPLHEEINYENKNWNDVPSEVELPSNLFVIGTVNIDETTYMFSPKVLDRANVIEFAVTKEEMSVFLEKPESVDIALIAGRGAAFASGFVAAASRNAFSLDELGENSGIPVKETVKKALEDLFDILASAGAEFGYRPAYEMSRFIYFYANVAGEGWKLDDAIDAAVMQKLLPKLHGSKTKLGPILEKLKTICKDRYPISFAKIERMELRLKQNGFTSYAEA